METIQAESSKDHVPAAKINETESKISLGAILMSVWMIIVTALLINFIRSQWKIHRFLRHADKVPSSVFPMNFEDLKASIHVRKSVAIVQSPDVAVPSVWGVFHPSLILPNDFFRQYSKEQIRWIVLHELAHIRRHDVLVSIFQKMTQIIYFFHPAVWLANWMVNENKEYICDDLAIALSDAPRRDCGQSILSMARKVGWKPDFSISFLGKFHGYALIRRRMMRILDEKRNLRVRFSLGMAVGLILAAFVTLPSVRATENLKESAPSNQTQVLTSKDEEILSDANNISQSILQQLNDFDGIGRGLISFNENKVLYWQAYRHSLFFGDWTENDYIKMADSMENIVYFLLSPDHKKFVAVLMNPVREEGTDKIKYVERELLLFSIPDLTKQSLLKSEEDIIYPSAWNPVDDVILISLGNRRENNWRIGIINSSNGALKIIKNCAYQPEHLSFTSDGKHIVYDYPQQGDVTKRDIFMMTIDDGYEVNLVNHPANDILLGFNIDTKNVLFRSDRRGDWSVMNLKIDENNRPKKLDLIETNIGEIEPICFLKNKSLIFYKKHNAMDTYTIQLDQESGKIIGQPGPITSNQEIAVHCYDWSPNGQNMAYFVKTQNKDKQTTLIIKNLSNSEVRKITVNEPELKYPRWSPDMSSILATNNNGIFQINISDEKVKLIAEVDKDTFADWWIDGKSIYYRQGRDLGREFSLRRLFLETGFSETIEIPKVGNIFYIVLSPDGKYFAYSDLSSGMSTIKIFPSKGGDSSVLYCTEGNRIGVWTNVAWSPDSQHVYFVKWKENTEMNIIETELWSVPISGEEPEFTGLKMEYIQDIRIHPNGDRLAFTSGSWKNQYWIMENILSKN